MMNNVQEQLESIGRHNFNLYYKDKYPNASEQQVNDFLDAYTDLYSHGINNRTVNPKIFANKELVQNLELYKQTFPNEDIFHLSNLDTQNNAFVLKLLEKYLGDKSSSGGAGTTNPGEGGSEGEWETGGGDTGEDGQNPGGDGDGGDGGDGGNPSGGGETGEGGQNPGGGETGSGETGGETGEGGQNPGGGETGSGETGGETGEGGQNPGGGETGGDNKPDPTPGNRGGIIGGLIGGGLLNNLDDFFNNLLNKFFNADNTTPVGVDQRNFSKRNGAC